MSAIISTKPYLLRAIYEWCADNGFTPYIAVKVQGLVQVPVEYVSDGNIVLNIAMSATNSLKMDNEAITFKGRFGGVPREIYVPISAVAAIYASENNQGMAFDVVPEAVDPAAVQEQPSAALVSDKPAISLAVTNPENSSVPDEKKSKTSIKKPSLTVIK